ncbi:MAG: hypothetical protein F9K30_11655 [Dechloromonas sp.]|nr:MAG: hypothetical protein F9K30_11655 [Dechloromonas sp.]
MRGRALELACRRGALQERIAAQRIALGQHAHGFASLCAGGDTVLRGVDWVKHHPATVGVAMLAVVLARPKRAWRWARRGIFLWRGWRTASKYLHFGR